eukprot:scaffold3549_cov128-Isochrysis_galbana.AAC.2
MDPPAPKPMPCPRRPWAPPGCTSLRLRRTGLKSQEVGVRSASPPRAPPCYPGSKTCWFKSPGSYLPTKPPARTALSPPRAQDTARASSPVPNPSPENCCCPTAIDDGTLPASLIACRTLRSVRMPSACSASSRHSRASSSSPDASSSGTAASKLRTASSSSPWLSCARARVRRLLPHAVFSAHAVSAACTASKARPISSRTWARCSWAVALDGPACDAASNERSAWSHWPASASTAPRWSNAASLRHGKACTREELEGWHTLLVAIAAAWRAVALLVSQCRWRRNLRECRFVHGGGPRAVGRCKCPPRALHAKADARRHGLYRPGVPCAGED